MIAQHLELLVEEPSMEAFLRALLPRLLPQDRSFDVRAFQGKPDLLRKLEARLRGYSAWLPEDWRIIVVVDREDNDCHELKRRLDDIGRRTGLRMRGSQRHWQLINRIAIEELEAWYFGDWDAVRMAYSRVPPTIAEQRNYRDSDAITGGTWEAFERIMQRRNYFRSGLAKIEVARTMGQVIDPLRNRSHSFQMLWQVLTEAVT